MGSGCSPWETLTAGRAPGGCSPGGASVLGPLRLGEAADHVVQGPWGAAAVGGEAVVLLADGD